MENDVERELYCAATDPNLSMVGCSDLGAAHPISMALRNMSALIAVDRSSPRGVHSGEIVRRLHLRDIRTLLLGHGSGPAASVPSPGCGRHFSAIEGDRAFPESRIKQEATSENEAEKPGSSLFQAIFDRPEEAEKTLEKFKGLLA